MDRAAEVIALDTNLLLYAHDRGAPENEAATRALAQGWADPRGWGVAVTVLAEFWSAATRADHRNSAAAYAFWSDLLASGLQVWPASAELGAMLLGMARRMEVNGRRIYDLQIAMIALENGADELWTHDAGFLRVPGLRYFDPISHSARR